VAYPGFYNGRGRDAAGAEGVGHVGGGYLLPTVGRVWVGGCALSPENFSYFLLKIPYFGAF